MHKLFLIGLKDVKLAFRDRAALILMLLAPFLLTLGLGVVTGRFSGGSSSGISHIPVVLVNQDGKQLGTALVDLFQSKDLGELVNPTLSDDPAAARKLVDDNQAVAAILIPAGFTDSILFPLKGRPPRAKPSRSSCTPIQPPPPVLAWSRPSWISSSARWRLGGSAGR